MLLDKWPARAAAWPALRKVITNKRRRNRVYWRFSQARTTGLCRRAVWYSVSLWRGPVAQMNQEVFKLQSLRLTAAAILLFGAHAFAAVSIQYKLVPVGGNVYRYVYSITNSSPTGTGAPVQLFDILFDTSRYQQSSLQIVTPSTLQLGWSETFLGALPGVPTAYDALALHGGVPAGNTVSGFAVQFTWLGSGLPGPQVFQIYDPLTFQLLQSGTTVADFDSVPAASMWSLILIGAGLTLAARRQVNRQNFPTSVI